MNVIKRIILLTLIPSGLVHRLKSYTQRKLIAVYEIVDFIRYYVRFNIVLFKVDLDIPAQLPVLFIFGRGMNMIWAQIWVFLSLSVIKSRTPVHFLIFPTRSVIKAYLSIVRPKFWKFSLLMDLAGDGHIHSCYVNFKTFSEIKEYYYEDLPIGQIVLSTYARYNFTGEIDIRSKEFVDFFETWVPLLIKTYVGAKIFFYHNKFSAVVFSETFCEDYGAIYYAALVSGLNVIKTSGTVQDEAILVQRRNMANARLHHAALSTKSWERINARVPTQVAFDAMEQNFDDRYGSKWYRSARNNNNSKNLSREIGRRELEINENRMVVIIFSHILYDALFHYGEELYDDYATWLISTVAEAIENPNVEWFIKYHPSNLWRGEFNSILRGQHEEDRILTKHFSQLPDNIHKIYPLTDFSPLTWIRIADVGISVRGTAGLEMACLGKPVVTAGTGRYEGLGFTLDPKTICEYKNMLRNIHEIGPLTKTETNLANLCAHGLFNLKPFHLSGLIPEIVTGKSSISASDDMLYLPSLNQPFDKDWAPRRFYNFLFTSQDEDLIRIPSNSNNSDPTWH